jgi:hypothetical protein
MIQKTVRVRILVATDRKGQWLAYGWNGGTDMERVREAMPLDDIDLGEIYHWIEADVPLPAEDGPTIEGVVESTWPPPGAS